MGAGRVLGSLHCWAATAVETARRGAAVLALGFLAGCGGGETNERSKPGEIVSRMITPALWAGTTATHSGAVLAGELPAVDRTTTDGLRIQGPVEVESPTGAGKVRAYMRTTTAIGGQRLQHVTVTQQGSGLGRILDTTIGLPERRFAGDVVFPLGLWKQGEIREFEAVEFTLAGTAQRRVTLEILDLDFVYKGAAHSLAYRLTIHDAANRVIGCETSVYSPGAGLVRFEASSGWSTSAGCSSCPCPR